MHETEAERIWTDVTEFCPIPDWDEMDEIDDRRETEDELIRWLHRM